MNYEHEGKKYILVNSAGIARTLCSLCAFANLKSGCPHTGALLTCVAMSPDKSTDYIFIEDSDEGRAAYTAARMEG